MVEGILLSLVAVVVNTSLNVYQVHTSCICRKKIEETDNIKQITLNDLFISLYYGVQKIRWYQKTILWYT